MNLDVRIQFNLHTESIAGCCWNDHGWMVILHWSQFCSVYRPFVVTTKLSSIVSMKKKKKKKKTDRTRCCNSWHHTQPKRRRHVNQASKKKGSMCVIEDTEREREKEKETERRRDTEERQKSEVWMEFDASVDGSGLTTANFEFFRFALSLSSFP